jgi:hypothetical protein
MLTYALLLLLLQYRLDRNRHSTKCLDDVLDLSTILMDMRIWMGGY